MRSAPVLLALSALSALASPCIAAPEIETSRFSQRIDFKNKPLGNRFVFTKKGVLRRHSLPGRTLHELHIESTDLELAEMNGQQVPIELIKMQAPNLFGKPSKTFEAETHGDLGPVRRVLTQQYADHVLLETLGRLCEANWDTIRDLGKGKTRISWELPGLFAFLTYVERVAEDGRRTITIAGTGEGPDAGTGPRTITDFMFVGTLSPESGRFTQVKITGTVFNETKRIEQTLTYERTLEGVEGSKDPEYARVLAELIKAVDLEQGGDHAAALRAYAALDGRPALKPFVAACQDYFGRVKRAAGGVPWKHESLERALTASQKSGRPVLVLFDQENCPPCAMLKRAVLTDPGFVREAEGACETLNLNACTDADLAKRMGVSGTPTLLLLDSRGEVLARQTGVRGVQASLQFLRLGVLAFQTDLQGSTPGLPSPNTKRRYF